jgi:hypothetical protein
MMDEVSRRPEELEKVFENIPSSSARAATQVWKNQHPGKVLLVS